MGRWRATGFAGTTGLADEGKTVAVLFEGKGALGLIAMRDEPRTDAIEAVRQLRAMGARPRS